MKFFSTLALIIAEDDLPKKFDSFLKLYQNFKADNVIWDETQEAIVWTSPSYASFCQIITPQKLPKRKKLDTKAGQIIFLHAIAHIEYSAIDLALDAAYRFREMPKAYYADWLEVASDEIRHFVLVETLLKELGSFYGALLVHNSLFEAGVMTGDSLLERMAVIPRFMEANGLDANPKFIQKLDSFEPTPMIVKMIAALELILEEEIPHVLKGDKWFVYACKEVSKPKDVYFDIIKKYYPKSFPRMHSVNIKARKAAGFSCLELEQITKEPC